MDNKQLLEEANYYLGNDVTMAESACHFNISKKSFQLHMKKLEEIYPEKFKLVQLKKGRNLALGMVKGGKNGKPTNHKKLGGKPFTLTKGEAISLAKSIITGDLSFREAEMLTGIPKSTIAGNLTEERIGVSLYNELTKVKKSHIPGNRRIK